MTLILALAFGDSQSDSEWEHKGGEMSSWILILALIAIGLAALALILLTPA